MNQLLHAAHTTKCCSSPIAPKKNADGRWGACSGDAPAPPGHDVHCRPLRPSDQRRHRCQRDRHRLRQPRRQRRARASERVLHLSLIRPAAVLSPRRRCRTRRPREWRLKRRAAVPALARVWQRASALVHSEEVEKPFGTERQHSETHTFGGNQRASCLWVLRRKGEARVRC